MVRLYNALLLYCRDVTIGTEGIEPSTYGLKVHHSATELRALRDWSFALGLAGLEPAT